MGRAFHKVARWMTLAVVAAVAVTLTVPAGWTQERQPGPRPLQQQLPLPIPLPLPSPQAPPSAPSADAAGRAAQTAQAAGAALLQAIAELEPRGTPSVLVNDRGVWGFVTLPQFPEPGSTEERQVGLLVRGRADGSPELMTLDVYARPEPGGALRITIKTKSGPTRPRPQVVWEGTSQVSLPSGVQLRPNFTPRIVCHEVMDLGPMDFVPASEEGDFPTHWECELIGWWGSIPLRVASWTVPPRVWRSPDAATARLSPERAGQVAEAVRTVTRAVDDAARALGLSPAQSVSALFDSGLPGTIAGAALRASPGGAALDITILRDGALGGAFTLARGAQPGVWTGKDASGATVQIHASPVPDPLRSRILGGPASARAIPFVSLDGVSVIAPVGGAVEMITIKCPSTRTCGLLRGPDRSPSASARPRPRDSALTRALLEAGRNHSPMASVMGPALEKLGTMEDLQEAGAAG
jgi:hypothetical protein